MSSFLSRMESQPRWLVLSICLLITAIIGVLDYVTGDLSLLVFYITPIFLAVWFLGRADGLFITLLCGAELCLIDRLLASPEIPFLSIRTWNSFMETLLLIFVSHTLASLKKELELNRKRAVDLAAANQELDAFNYSVAHDLRRPLTNISGCSQMVTELCGDKMDLECRGYLSEIFAGTLRMNQIIEALLNFSRVAHCDLRMEGVDLSDMAGQIVDELRRAEPGRKVHVRIAEGAIAFGDPQLLRIVMENLLGNAWKYTAKKGEAVISFGTIQSGKSRVCFVSDNGAGFDGTKADKLFVPFQRLHEASQFSGIGIGLATVQRIVQCHGGRIWAEGEPDKGATIFFTLGTS